MAHGEEKQRSRGGGLVNGVSRGEDGGVFEGFSSGAGSWGVSQRGGSKWAQEPPRVLASSAGLCCSPGAGLAGNLRLSPVPNQRL